MRSFFHFFAVATALTACAFTASPVASAQKPYKVLASWKVGGEGSWDYLLEDAPNHRLYVSHETKLEVIDTLNGAVVGSIGDFSRLHGVAFDPDGKTAYVSDGGANAVVVFDRTSLKKIASIPVGQNPDGIIWEPSTKTLWTFNGKSSDASVVDPATRTVIATLPLGGKPEFPTVDGKGGLFVNMEESSTILRIDPKEKKITATWKLTGCEGPSGMAIDTAGRRLFSVCDKKMAVVNADTGKILASPMIGDGPDATAYDAKHNVIFASNGDGRLSIVDGKTYKVTNLPTKAGARTLAFDPNNGHVYLTYAVPGPPQAKSATNPRGRAAALPGSFSVLVVGKE